MKVRTNSTRTAIVAVTAVAVVGVIAGIANAAIPAANGTHVACYNKKSGALRLTEGAKKCTKREKRTSWNAKGIQGAQGIQGVKGDTGAKGDTGPSNGYFDEVDTLTPVPNSATEILALGSLPAGSYVFNFTADYADGAGGGVLDCAVSANSQHWATKVETEAGRRTNVALTGAVTLAAAGDISVICDDNNGDESLAQARITAIKVGTLAQA